MTNKSFWRGKKVFLTGHTGFKGAWLAFILTLFGATVKGYSLAATAMPNLFSALNLAEKIESILGDVRDLENLQREFNAFQPEIVFHLAAQPLVLEGYRNPVETYSTNVMGTVNILECIRGSPTVRSVINVTTDKVYHNNEWCYGYRETDTLDGIDPYSNSKSCSELVTGCYSRSFLSERGVAVSTCRAGNVIGGGDFAENRIIPDCVRAALQNQTVEVRNPNSVRPYQHVLDVLFAYMMVAEAQYADMKFADSYNVAPEDEITTGELAELFCQSWGEGLRWETKSRQQKREANLLKLDSSKLKATFDWQNRWGIGAAVDKSVEWYKLYRDGADIFLCMENQVKEFLREG